ncbi:MAG: DUF1232 domain-containing protein [Ignavibacteriae bacterium]|jgi:uncharacterized membrane protein YkvA (DUF1232 family)|nr:DUF1232 domain-containing protein [Ignavibacteriota bacterium]
MNESNKLSQEELIREIEKKAEEIKPARLDEILKEENKIKDKGGKLNLTKFSQFFKNLKLAMEMLKDYRSKSYTNIPWRSIALLAAGIIYFMNPFDIVPDFFPIIGFTDDAVMLAAILKSMQGDLKKYCDWKGYKAEEYFV